MILGYAFLFKDDTVCSGIKDTLVILTPMFRQKWYLEICLFCHYNIYQNLFSNHQVALFKFVRMAGDLLPASLYVPYINMLTGLSYGSQNANHCFNLLKMNGNLSYLM